MDFDVYYRGRKQYVCVFVFVCVWHQWRSAAKKKLEEDDFSFAREVRDREKRLQALEEQLEQRARSAAGDVNVLLMID